MSTPDCWGFVLSPTDNAADAVAFMKLRHFVTVYSKFLLHNFGSLNSTPRHSEPEKICCSAAYQRPLTKIINRQPAAAAIVQSSTRSYMLDTIHIATLCYEVSDNSHSASATQRLFISSSAMPIPGNCITFIPRNSGMDSLRATTACLARKDESQTNRHTN